MANDSAETTAQLTINLNADDVDGSAASAAQALDKLKASIKADTAEIASMQRALKNLKGATVVNSEQFGALSKSITAQKAKLAESQSSYIKLGGTFQATATKVKQPGDQVAKLQTKLDALKKSQAGGADKAAKPFERIGTEAKKLPGPLGEVVGKLMDMKEGLATANLGSLALAGGLAALIGVTVAAIAKLTELGIAHGDARRSELLHLEALTKVRNYYGVAAGSAKEMQAAIDRVAASTAASRSDVAGFADELYKGHLRGENFSQALEGMAIKATALGPAAAHAFGGFATAVGFAGGSVKRLSDDVKARFGGIVQKQMQSLTVQAMKQKESFDALFDGINVDKFVAAKKTVSDLLSQTTASGRAIKALMGSLVQPIVDMATRAQPLVKRFFQGMIESALELQIAYYAIKIAFKKAFSGLRGLTQDADKLNVALDTGKVVMYTFAAALGAAAVAAVAFAWPVLLAGAAIWALFEIASNFMQVWNEIDWALLGESILDGIVRGLVPGPIVDAMESLGKAAWSSFKEALGIHSPSKVFADLGLAIPQGVAVGVDAGAPTARSAVDDMLDVPRIPSGGAQPDGSTPPVAGKSAAGAVYNFNFGDISLGAKAGGGKEQAHDFVNELSRVLEGVSIQIGAPNVGEAA